MEQAIIDLTNANKRYFTQLWFTSDNHAPGSFLWICDHLDLDPSWLRRRLFALVDVAPVSRRPPRWYRNKGGSPGQTASTIAPPIDDLALTLTKPFTDGAATFLLAPAASSSAQCVWALVLGHRSNAKLTSHLDRQAPAIDQAPALATPELDAGLFLAGNNGAGKIVREVVASTSGSPLANAQRLAERN